MILRIATQHNYPADPIEDLDSIISNLVNFTLTLPALETKKLMYFILFLFQLWHQYDTDNSGFIEADELKVRKKMEKF